MAARLPLFTKVLFLAFLNLCLLGLVIAFIVRVQFRMDARSFLLAPAQDRIMAVAHVLALELEETPPGMWDPVLERYSETHGVGFHLFDEGGDRLAGPELQLPREVVERIPRRARRRDSSPPPARPIPTGKKARPKKRVIAGRLPLPCFCSPLATPPATGPGSAFPCGKIRRKIPNPAR